ncbi:sodium/calcium exchanger family protein [Collimonas arenae]|uniref:Sodium/calcium exchanger family protein n=1 Tax=Collimonas arenae TaxID=279058 RepID=A0A127PMT2_9BURK|nr:sodium:calcium antiporter [Collimonas arenae]AMO99085.1 sodium/calcium exchanger family protein [Collimonas arenae]AMP08985.1 sodium/calcium exchanger family protein [Collimonas arenae]
MMLAIALLLGSAVVIYLSCEYFVNSIEWVGRRLGIAQSAVGTVLAAFGTALPESVVTFVAVVFGRDAAHREIGVGAALGGPLVLATIAYAVVGLMFVLNRKKLGGILLSASAAQRLSRDQAWFIGIFLLKVGLGLVAFTLKPWLGILFLLAYGVYIWGEMRKEEDADAEVHDLEPLKFRPHNPQPGIGWALLQTLVALVVIFLSSQLFVHQLGEVSPWLGISPQLTALLLSPIATELPEILNAVIWVRQGKQTLALSNISGAMMIQATIPTALVLIFTPWMLGPALLWAAAVTMLSMLGLYALLRKGMLTGGRLALFGVLYLLFAAGLGTIGVH